MYDFRYSAHRTITLLPTRNGFGLYAEGLLVCVLGLSDAESWHRLIMGVDHELHASIGEALKVWKEDDARPAWEKVLPSHPPYRLPELEV